MSAMAKLRDFPIKKVKVDIPDGRMAKAKLSNHVTAEKIGDVAGLDLLLHFGPTGYIQATFTFPDGSTKHGTLSTGMGLLFFVELHDEQARPAAQPPHFIDVVFDGPPSAEAGRFVEVENEAGSSVNAGECGSIAVTGCGRSGFGGCRD